MPSREESARGNRPQRGATPPVRNNGANARQVASARASQGSSEDEVWDEIMDMKQGGGGEGGFDKMNTNFFLKDGEEIDIVLMDNVPTVFNGHIIKCQGQRDDGSTYTFYRTEQCQKSAQDYCVLCESQNSAVGKAKKVIAFRVLDSRGSWDKTLNNGNGGLNGIPTPKIFLVPIYLAKQFKTLRDDAGGELTDKVIKLSKNGNYQANFKFKKNNDGSLRYLNAPDYDGEIPEILDVYVAMEDDDLIDFVRKFANAGNGGGQAPQRGGNSGGSNRRAGSFGD